jgi:hypothetical protein
MKILETVSNNIVRTFSAFSRKHESHYVGLEQFLKLVRRKPSLPDDYAQRSPIELAVIGRHSTVRFKRSE